MIGHSHARYEPRHSQVDFNCLANVSKHYKIDATQLASCKYETTSRPIQIKSIVNVNILEGCDLNATTPALINPPNWAQICDMTLGIFWNRNKKIATCTTPPGLSTSSPSSNDSRSNIIALATIKISSKFATPPPCTRDEVDNLCIGILVTRLPGKLLALLKSLEWAVLGNGLVLFIWSSSEFWSSSVCIFFLKSSMGLIFTFLGLLGAASDAKEEFTSSRLELLAVEPEQIESVSPCALFLRLWKAPGAVFSMSSWSVEGLLGCGWTHLANSCSLLHTTLTTWNYKLILQNSLI